MRSQAPSPASGGGNDKAQIVMRMISWLGLNDVGAHCRQGVDCGLRLLRDRGDEIDCIGLAVRDGLRLNVAQATALTPRS